MTSNNTNIPNIDILDYIELKCIDGSITIPIHLIYNCFKYYTNEMPSNRINTFIDLLYDLKDKMMDDVMAKIKDTLEKDDNMPFLTDEEKEKLHNTLLILTNAYSKVIKTNKWKSKYLLTNTVKS
jgi:hypothetical protein